jgi:hypothetical protein
MADSPLTLLGEACFAASTHLRTQNGSKAIEEIRRGDQVLSTDEFEPGGQVRPRHVLGVARRVTKIVELTVGGKLIRVSAEHPFWVKGKGWTVVRLLQKGDLLRSHDGQYVAVDGWEDLNEYVTVYNLEVEGDHTYFVGETGWGFSVWAHNASRTTCPPMPAAEARTRPPRSGSGRNEPHGRQPGTRLLEQVQDLEDQLAELIKAQGSRREKQAIINKIRNLNKEIDRMRRGETHHR